MNHGFFIVWNRHDMTSPPTNDQYLVDFRFRSFFTILYVLLYIYFYNL